MQQNKILNFLQDKMAHKIYKTRYVSWVYQHIAADPPGAGQPCSVSDLLGTFV